MKMQQKKSNEELQNAFTYDMPVNENEEGNLQFLNDSKRYFDNKESANEELPSVFIHLPVQNAFSYVDIEHEVSVNSCNENNDEIESIELNTCITESTEMLKTNLVNNDANVVKKEECMVKKVVGEVCMTASSAEEYGAEKMNFILRLKSVVINVVETCEREERSTSYEFEVQIAGNLLSTIVSAKELEDSAWVKRITQGRAYIPDNKVFKRYLHCRLEESFSIVPQKYLYAQQGWKKLHDGRIVYVCDSEIVGKSILANTGLALSDNWISSNSGMKFEIDLSKVFSFESVNEFINMQSICRNVDVSRSLMVFASLSVISTLFDMVGFPIKFVLGLLGTTNTLKTSTAMVFSNIFNATTKKKPDVTFASTQSGIETYVSKYSDAILLVDDFMPATNAKKQSELDSKLELICRLYGDRTSKKRMCDFSYRHVEYPVKGCCMFTGELINGVQSSITRIFVVELERGEIDKENLKYYQSYPLILPTYLYGFINHIQQNINRILPFIAESVTVYRNNACYEIARLNELQGVMFTAIDLMVDYWDTFGFMNEKSSVVLQFQESISRLIMRNQRNLNQQSIPEMAIHALYESIYMNPKNLKHIDEIEDREGDFIYEDEDFYYIRLVNLLCMTKEYARRFDQHFTIQKNMLVQQLRECEIIETGYENGRIVSSRKLKQGKNTMRFLYLIKEEVRKIYERQVN